MSTDSQSSFMTSIAIILFAGAVFGVYTIFSKMYSFIGFNEE